MQITLTFKMPDVLDQIRDQVGSDNGQDEAVINTCRKWIKYDEYVYLDVDTKAGTVKVREIR